ncbi:MAG: hypothetical protein J6X18_12510 [Bacteroidales bacterium]|nr:hypothetical protein [Bacteroidales bacterium]
MVKYGIFEIVEHDSGRREKPSLHRGWFNTIEEAEEVLKDGYYNGEKQRFDNDFYGIHYTYWDEIYASDTEHPIQFYDMDDYVRELVDGKTHSWNLLSDEQKEMVIKASPLETKFWLALKGKIDIKTDKHNQN